jgi:hypothetical protein
MFNSTVLELASGLIFTFLSVSLATSIIVEAIANVPRAENPQINNVLRGAIQRGVGDLDAVKKEIAGWFDSGMDRLSGAYKRWSQLVSVLVALALCVLLNVDTVHIARALWASPSIAAKVKPTQDVTSSVTQLVQTFPVGWPAGLFAPVAEPATMIPGATTRDYGEAIVGWLITALATLFGAQFWFDVLQNVVRLKGAGASPNEKSSNKAAAA